jgi:CRISPR type III-A-associated protein Csm2
MPNRSFNSPRPYSGHQGGGANRPSSGGGGDRQHHGGGHANSEADFTDEIKSTIGRIIVGGFDKAAMEEIEKIGTKIRSVSSSQIRIAYGEVTRLVMKAEVPISEVLMLKPKLAYAAGRAPSNKKGAYMFLKQVISHAVDITAEVKDNLEQTKRFRNLALMFEAILAYHKAAGGEP